MPLSTGEYLLLTALLRHPGLVLSRDQLLDLTRGREAQPFDRSVDNQVSRLRKKLERDPEEPPLIKTHWGGGYSFAGAGGAGMSRLWPRSMTGQLVAILLLALVLAQLVTFAILQGERQSTVEAIGREQVLERAAALVRLLEETTEAGERRRALRAFSTRRLRFWLADEAVVEAQGGGPAVRLARKLEDLLEGEGGHEVLTAMSEIGRRAHGPPRWHRQLSDAGVEPQPPDDPGLLVAIRVGPESWLNAAMLCRPSARPSAWRRSWRSSPPPSPVQPPRRSGSGASPGRWRRWPRLPTPSGAASRSSCRPTAARSRSAGPPRRSTACRRGIGRAMAERTRLLAAISHDLRTPIHRSACAPRWWTGGAPGAHAGDAGRMQR
ncbi:MAG: winged helix-turn-helix domain-containing protein [Geminicoccaceae bacterium]